MAQYVNILQSWQFSFQSLAYVVAALLFILALAGLSRQTTAQRGNPRRYAGHGSRARGDCPLRRLIRR